MKQLSFSPGINFPALKPGIAFLVIIAFALNVTANDLAGNATMQVKASKADDRIILLEKLENGQSVTQEEIKALLAPSSDRSGGIYEFEFPEMPEIPEFPRLSFPQDICVNPPHICFDPETFCIDDKAMEEMRQNISRSLDEMKKEIESVIHSEEMMNFHRELKLWGEEVRKEVEKAMKGTKPEKDSGVKSL